MNVALILILTLAPYRLYRVIKKHPKVDMFLVQFYVIFLIWAVLLESINKIVNIDTT